MATVPMMAIGIALSGFPTSSARCVAESRQANTQFGLMSPTMKASPSEPHPVELTKVANTNLASEWVGAAAGTVIRMTVNEINEMYNVVVATLGSNVPTQLNR